MLSKRIGYWQLGFEFLEPVTITKENVSQNYLIIFKIYVSMVCQLISPSKLVVLPRLYIYQVTLAFKQLGTKRICI